LLVTSACSKGPEGSESPINSASTSTAASISSFPATLEGNLAISVTNDWGYFGDITVAGKEYPVSIPASIFEASGVPAEGGKVRIVVESRQEMGSASSYIASSIARL
jgi:hypothetical protein